MDRILKTIFRDCAIPFFTCRESGTTGAVLTCFLQINSVCHADFFQWSKLNRKDNPVQVKLQQKNKVKLEGQTGFVK